MVASWLMHGRVDSLAERYLDVIGERRIVVAFETVTELLCGALYAGWGELRRRALDRSLTRRPTVRPDDRMITLCAELRHQCAQVGHALAAKVHDGDRWIAATALRVGGVVVSHDGIFADVPGVDLLTLLSE
ncbi:MAG: PIN domain-containing protein [Acidimicrobiales bacterium]